MLHFISSQSSKATNLKPYWVGNFETQVPFILGQAQQSGSWDGRGEGQTVEIDSDDFPIIKTPQRKS